jgi:hypothetical protein
MHERCRIGRRLELELDGFDGLFPDYFSGVRQFVFDVAANRGEVNEVEDLLHALDMLKWEVELCTSPVSTVEIAGWKGG